MKKIKIFLLLFLTTSVGTLVFGQDNTSFKLFKKSDDFSGFGGLTLQMLNGDYFLFGGHGAARYGNYYFGGFGFSGYIGRYEFPLSFVQYDMQRASGGLIIGGLSNTKEIFALYGDFKLSFDQYDLTPVQPSGNGLPSLSNRNISFLPSAGVVFRPIQFIEVRLGAGFNLSGLIDDGGLENVPYRTPMFNFDINFVGY